MAARADSMADDARPASSRAAWIALAIFAGAWLASLATLARSGISVAEPILLLVLFGLALPGIALLVCRGIPRRPWSCAIAGEPAMLAALALLVTLFLAGKGPVVAALTGPAPDPRLRDAVNTLVKLAVFVAIPLAVYAWRGRLFPRDFDLTWPPRGLRGRSLAAFAAVGAVFAAIQIFLGRGMRPLLDGSLAHRHWILGLVLCFLWMSVEAGMVEETFFRAILQSRLSATMRSSVAGILLSALVFGLSHAPGLWLRGAGSVEGLGGAPSLPVSIAYSVTTMGVAGIVFGVLWARTRNWLLVVALHGLGDALSNAPAFIATWKL